MNREEIKLKHGNCYDTKEVQEAFEIISFLVPFCMAKDKTTNEKVVLQFQYNPRFYWRA